MAWTRVQSLFRGEKIKYDGIVTIILLLNCWHILFLFLLLQNNRHACIYTRRERKKALYVATKMPHAVSYPELAQQQPEPFVYFYSRTPSWRHSAQNRDVLSSCTDQRTRANAARGSDGGRALQSLFWVCREARGPAGWPWLSLSPGIWGETRISYRVDTDIS